MSIILTLAVLALAAALVLSRHRAADLAAQRDDLAAEADDLRGEVRQVRAELAWARRTTVLAVAHVEKREAAAVAAAMNRLARRDDELAAARARKRPRAVRSS